jgi:hypothetical protein
MFLVHFGSIRLVNKYFPLPPHVSRLRWARTASREGVGGSWALLRIAEFFEGVPLSARRCQGSR